VRLPPSTAVAEAASGGLLLKEGESVGVEGGESEGAPGVAVGGAERRAVPVTAAGVSEGAGAMVAEGVIEALARAVPLDSAVNDCAAVAVASDVGVPGPPPKPPPALALTSTPGVGVETLVGMMLPVTAAVPRGERVGQWGETLGEEEGVEAPPGSPPPPLGSAVAVLLPPTPALAVGEAVARRVG
jgi:hypothetical protein